MALLALIAFCVAFFSAHAAFADQGKDADLRAQVQQLEKRVAELEKQIKDLRTSAREAPRTETEKKLVGTWVVSDADRKEAWFSDMKLNGDGTCSVVTSVIRAGPDGTYRVIGRQISFTVPLGGGAFTGWEGQIASVTEAELVIEMKKGDAVLKMHYTRAK
jgi:hypothetical protein